MQIVGICIVELICILHILRNTVWPKDFMKVPCIYQRVYYSIVECRHVKKVIVFLLLSCSEPILFTARIRYKAI